MRKRADALNAVIHSRNLYVVFPELNRRVIDARVLPIPHAVGKRIFLRDLHNETDIPLEKDTVLYDGYGAEVLE